MSSTQDTARSIVRRLIAERTKALAGATAVLVLVGLMAVIADSYGLAFTCILLLQAAIAGYLLTTPETRNETGAAQAAIDRASARTLADIAHARQSILDAIAEIDPRTK